MKRVRVSDGGTAWRYNNTKTALSQHVCVCDDGFHVIYDTRKGKNSLL